MSNIPTEHKYPAVSVIVPVYNVEKYIHRCLDSIAAQTFTDWECILVDDGSPDRCGAICDEYAAADPRFRVIHQANGGVSRARQAGVDAATGEYTIHCDPDDWVEPAMLASLYAKAKADDADMVICDFYIEQNGITTRCHQEPQSYVPCDVIRQMLTPPQAPFQQLHGSCCNKLVRRACYSNENSVCFSPEDISICEDLLFNIRILHYIRKVSYLDKAFYHYMDNDSSLSKDFRKKKVLQLITIAQVMSNDIGIAPSNLYSVKRLAMYNAFLGKNFEMVTTMFPEMKDQIIANGKPYRFFSPVSSCLSIALRGYPKFAYFIHQLNFALIDFYLKIRNLFFR